MTPGRAAGAWRLLARVSAGLAVAMGAACALRPAPAPEALRVLVYNVHAGKDGAGVDNLERVAALVRSTAADVVLLQEVDRGTRRSGGVDQLEVLTRLTGFHGAFGKSLDYQGGDYGIALLSRWPITRDSVVRLPVDPPQDRSGTYEPRVAHVGTIETPWGPLLAINTHIDASRSDRWRLQEARTLVSLTRALRERTPDALVLLGGDLNSEPGSAVQALIADGGLRDAWSQCGSGAGLTFRSDSAVKRIDYLYLTGRATCATADVLETVISDHRPLLVRVMPPRR